MAAVASKPNRRHRRLFLEKTTGPLAFESLSRAGRESLSKINKTTYRESSFSRTYSVEHISGQSKAILSKPMQKKKRTCQLGEAGCSFGFFFSALKLNILTNNYARHLSSGPVRFVDSRECITNNYVVRHR